MEGEAERLLRESIRHWRRVKDRVVVGPLDWKGFNYLCGSYLLNYNKWGGKPCVGCPVMKRTGKEMCEGTPFIAVLELQEQWVKTGERPEHWESVVDREIVFLQDLLAEE